MNALHPKASYWIRSGVFDDLQSFTDFESRVNEVPEEKGRGDIFEIFVEGYLATQAITQRVKHWIVGDIPLPLRERYKLPRDATGIDGIYETHDGGQVAYQVKYRKKRRLTFAEVAPFLGITEQFGDRVIFTNAAVLSDKAIQRTRWVGRDAFVDLSPNVMRGVEAWLKGEPVPITRAVPDPSYQVQALADIRVALETNDRATAVMACGTGKTLVALWASEQAEPKTVLVLVPSLTLLQQTLREWSEQTRWGDKFSYICVCSDQSVDTRDDGLCTDKTELGFRVDTDPRTVREFLQRETVDVKVVFSTYHSSPVVGEGARDLPAFDFAIFDEAHKTTGHSDSAFSYALSDKNLRIRKRLFLTATPRHIDIRHRDKEGEFRVQSMDDVAVYGPRAYRLSFAAAAAKGVICPYKVIISLIDKQMVDDFARNHGITHVAHDEIATRWMANLIALVQAVNHVKATKIISFHSRIRLAQEFASSEPRGVAHYLQDFDVRHVNGGQSSAERSEVIRAFADAPRSLLTNARCLTEGVNIPEVDMVAFIDPRHSRIDVAQAVGRAMRKLRGDTNKQIGYVVVPVFAGSAQNDSIDTAITSQRFDVVADVLNALQEQDDELVDAVREIRERKGAGDPFNPRRLAERLEVIGPRIELDRLTASIALEIADRIGTSWDEWYGVLLRYKSGVGNCRVPIDHRVGTYKLGYWVNNQRATRQTLPAERRQRLDDIGLEWSLQHDIWEEHFSALERFESNKKNCLVPARYVDGELRLGGWVQHQRKTRETLPADRSQRLESLGFEWVVRQRRVRDAVSVERRQRLDIPGTESGRFAAYWEEGFAALEQFKARMNHCRVPQGHVEGKFKLGKWVNRQRNIRETMSAERRQRLSSIGFEWAVRHRKKGAPA